MTTVAAINTNFTATTGNLEKNTKRAEKIVGGFGKNISSLAMGALPNIGTIITGAAIGFAVKKIFGAIKSELDELGKINDQAINLGLEPAKLQQLQFAAAQAGVSAESLSAALIKMSRETGKAPDQAIREVADAMAAATGPAERIQIAFDKAGRSGAQLIAMLSGGSAALDESAKLAQSLGFNLTELDVALSDLAGDALGQLGSALDNVWKQFVVELSPAITVIAEALAQLVGSFAQGTDASYGMSRGIIDLVGNTVDGFNNIRGGILRIEGAFLELIGNMLKALGATETARGLLSSSRDAFLMAHNIDQLDVSQEWQKKLDDVIRRGEEAAAKARQLRGAGLDEAGSKGSRAQPGAVDFGTRSAIEAMNKAFGAKSDDVPKKQLRKLENIDENLQEIGREIVKMVNDPSIPAQIVP